MKKWLGFIYINMVTWLTQINWKDYMNFKKFFNIFKRKKKKELIDSTVDDEIITQRTTPPANEFLTRQLNTIDLANEYATIRGFFENPLTTQAQQEQIMNDAFVRFGAGQQQPTANPTPQREDTRPSLRTDFGITLKPTKEFQYSRSKNYSKFSDWSKSVKKSTT